MMEEIKERERETNKNGQIKKREITERPRKYRQEKMKEMERHNRKHTKKTEEKKRKRAREKGHFSCRLTAAAQ